MNGKKIAGSFLNFFFVLLIGVIWALGIGFVSNAEDDDSGKKDEPMRAEARLIADGSDEVLQEGGFLNEEDVYYNASSGRFCFDAVKLMNKLKDAWESGEEYIDIRDLKIPKEKYGDVEKVYWETLNSASDYFFLRGSFEGYYNPDTNYMTYIKSLYLYNKTDRLKMLREYSDAIEVFRRGVDPKWTDIEKVMYIHEYLSHICVYDGDESLNNRFNAYGVMVENRAVCQGYALAFNGLAHRLGVESYIVTSYEMNHAWNMVKLNGKYYMLDVTWDDKKNIGRVGHRYLLKSMSWFNSEEGGHQANDYVVQDDILPTQCNDKKYNSYFLDDLDVSLEYINGKWYGFNSKDCSLNIYTCDGKDWKVGEKIIDLKDIHWDVPGGYYRFDAVGSVFSHNNKLYYSRPDCIYSYNPTSKKSSKVYDVPDDVKKLGNIIGICKTPNNKIKYLVSKDLKPENGTIKNLKFTDTDADITGPSVIISVGDNRDHIFRSPDNVVYSTVSLCTITAIDDTGVRNVAYHITKGAFNEEEMIIIRESSWKKTDGKKCSFDINNGADGVYYVYARSEDSSGNMGYSSLGKIVIDKTKPVITPEGNKTEYAGEATVWISDNNLDKVYVNGKETVLDGGKLKLSASDKPYEIRVTDKAKNEASLTLKVNPSKANNNSVIKVNKVVTDKKTSAKYKITKIVKKSGKITGGTVAYIKPNNKNCKKATVPGFIVLNGVKFKVTVIAKNAFKNNKSLKTVIIGANVKKIGSNAFRNCKNLKKITFKSKNITQIGGNAFKGIYKKANVIIPKKKLTKYKKLLKKGGLGKNAVIKSGK